MKRAGVVFILFFVCYTFSRGQIALPESLPQGHPRVLTTFEGKEEVLGLIHREQWAAEVFRKLKERTDRYADREPEWLVSRLQMY